ncbi:metal dependent phosphohydrolase [Thermodesulfatator indicus DSM 15286]|uniref:Metal dependent phosphohydrolase n=1 Tax=Thermodesulfatator indicus (strain DSM 15286 / JCM 11887 / CIR29812) TaxID=667014 RepID=F8AB70_THEID|nr:HD domain-containing phosphohydrolase [Thermodesulfatator indicus]AEH45526.1 metal dependent phosphohydrolase [Thermodesulfatator indicus DSM 15286]
MVRELLINLNNFFLSVSDAIDLANPHISAHQIKVAYISWRMGKLFRLSSEKTNQLYIAALFHDVGALTPQDKLRLHSSIEKNLDLHCIKGEELFKSLKFLAPIAPLIRFHHKPWHLWQEEGFSLNSPYVLESQILNLADTVERLVRRKEFILEQRVIINKKILSLSKKEFHPEVVNAFLELSKQECFWFDLTNHRLYSILLKYGPLESVHIGIEEIAQLAGFFSKIIDFKSQFTSTHSSGVVACATMLSHLCGFTELEILHMKVAASLHDLGKLAIPNFILEKPGRLTPEEFNIIKQHTYYTYMILSSVEGFETIAEWAAFHHEKLDGSGYPFGLTGDRLSLGARIMAVADIFTALIEERPYRNPMTKKEVLEILTNQVKKGLLDKRIVKIVTENYEDIEARVKKYQKLAEKTYLEQFQKAA